MQLSPHFTLAEATTSATAVARGIDNTPSDGERLLLRYVALHMEHVRRLLGNNPITITSWFRSGALNKAVGGVPDSAHRLGQAVDFTCYRFGSVLAICQAIEHSPLMFDQLIWEKGAWVHLSFEHTLRRQVLQYDGRSYKPGLPS